MANFRNPSNEVMESIEMLVRGGHPLAEACDVLGVHRKTFSRWKAKQKQSEANEAHPFLSAMFPDNINMLVKSRKLLNRIDECRRLQGITDNRFALIHSSEFIKMLGRHRVEIFKRLQEQGILEQSDDFVPGAIWNGVPASKGYRINDNAVRLYLLSLPELLPSESIIL